MWIIVVTQKLWIRKVTEIIIIMRKKKLEENLRGKNTREKNECKKKKWRCLYIFVWKFPMDLFLE